MAINTTNSNFVNISNLPQTQEALNGDLLILQTENGTQTIDFTNFNVVKTDAAGNATITGNLTGNNARFNVISAAAINSSVYAANSKTGTTSVKGYYNYFTIDSGLVTSAVQTSPSPEYTNITGTFLPNLTSWQNTIYKRIVDVNGNTVVLAGQTYSNVTIPNFYTTYTEVGDTDLKSWHVQILTLYGQPNATNPISSIPWASDNDNSALTTLTKDGSNLKFRLNAGYPMPQNVTFYYRILFTY